MRIAAGYDFVAHSSETAAAGAIQRGVNAANTDEAVVPADGDTVEVQAGTYVANGYYTDAAAGVVSELNIDKPLTLLGPNATFRPELRFDASERPSGHHPRQFRSRSV